MAFAAAAAFVCSAFFLTAVAAQQPARSGRLLGIVTDAAGAPMANAVVRILPATPPPAGGTPGAAAAAGPPARVRRTAVNGGFAFSGLPSGTYWIQAGRGRRISARRQVRVRQASTAYLALPLVYVLGSLRVGAPGERPFSDFGWLLRADEARRPVLRWRRAQSEADREGGGDSFFDGLNGYLNVMAGGSPLPLSDPGGVSTSFQLQRAIAGQAALEVSGTLGTTPMGVASGASQLSAAFAPNGEDNPERLVVSVRQIPLPASARTPNVQVITFNYADQTTVGALTLQYGTMLSAVSMVNSLRTLDPYLRAAWKLGPDASIEYRFASATPPVHFGRDYAAMADPTPRLTLVGNDPQIERGRHQEVNYTRHDGPNWLQVAVFQDALDHAAVSGAGADAADLAGGNLLPDPFNDIFTGDGGAYAGLGARAAYGRAFASTWRAIVAWSDGAVLAPRPGAVVARGELAGQLATAHRQAVTLKLSGVAPLAHTRIVCSYRWLNGRSATPVDPYDDSAAAADSFANVTVRQPLPAFLFGGNRVEALAEFNNLLAQGYIPVMSADGHLLYLIQAARSFRGGLTFNF